MGGEKQTTRVSPIIYFIIYIIWLYADVQTMSFDDSGRDDFDTDPFLRLLESYEQQEPGVDVPLKVNREILRSLNKGQVRYHPTKKKVFILSNIILFSDFHCTECFAAWPYPLLSKHGAVSPSGSLLFLLSLFLGGRFRRSCNTKEHLPSLSCSR